MEKFAQQNWTEFLAINDDLAEEFEKYIESLKNQPITINETIWEKYVSSQNKDQQETIQQLDLKKLIEEQINQRLGNWKPTETLEENWTNISLEFTPDLIQDWKRGGFAYETCKEWIDIGLTVNDAEFAQWLRNSKKLTPEETLNSNSEDLRKQFNERPIAEEI